MAKLGLAGEQSSPQPREVRRKHGSPDEGLATMLCIVEDDINIFLLYACMLHLHAMQFIPSLESLGI